MGLLDQAGKQAVDELTSQTVPSILAGIASDVKLVTDSISKVVEALTSVAIPALADGISQVVMQVSRLDGMKVTLKSFTMPAIEIEVSLPVYNKGE